MIKYISGDILQSKDEYIAQGVAVGSQEGLGTGLAFKLSSQFPERFFVKFGGKFFSAHLANSVSAYIFL